MLGATVARAANRQQEHLGDAHQLVIDQSFAMRAGHSSWGSGGAEYLQSNQIGLSPALSYFPIAGLSLGLRANVSYVSTKFGGQTNKTLDLGITPSVGYVQALSEHLYLWPQLGVELSREKQLGANAFEIYSTMTAITPRVEALLAWSPAEHFFVAAGPSAGVTWNKNGDINNRGTNVALMTSVGGYFSP